MILSELTVQCVIGSFLFFLFSFSGENLVTRCYWWIDVCHRVLGQPAFCQAMGACQQMGFCVFGHVPTPSVIGQGIKYLTPQCRHNKVSSVLWRG
jgi:hypothetical protein